MSEQDGETTEPVNLVDLIGQLHEAPEPPPIPMLPQTWGWAVLVVIVLVLLAIAAWSLFRRYRANAYRRQALVDLEASGGDPARIAEILRRTALAAWPRKEVAGLTGPDWLRFLDSHGVAGFADGPGRIIAEAPYRQCNSDPRLIALARRWIRRHKPEKRT